MKKTSLTRRAVLQSLGAMGLAGCGGSPNVVGDRASHDHTTSDAGLGNPPTSGGSPDRPNTKERLQSHFSIRLNVEAATLYTLQPLAFAVEVLNHSSEPSEYPASFSHRTVFLTDASSSDECPFISKILINSKELWWERFDGTRRIPPNDCESWDFRCYRRDPPPLLCSHTSDTPLFPKAGHYSVAMTWYEDGPRKGGHEKPFVVSPTVSLRVVQATGDEENALQRMWKLRLLRNGDEYREFADQFKEVQVLEAFLEAHPDLPLADDVHECLAHVYHNAAASAWSGRRRDDEDTFELEALTHRFAISPRRFITYRKSIQPFALDMLSRRVIQQRLDVPAILQKLRDHPPWPDLSEFASRRKWLVEQLAAIEASIDKNKQRPPDPNKKVTVKCPQRGERST